MDRIGRKRITEEMGNIPRGRERVVERKSHLTEREKRIRAEGKDEDV